MGVLCVWCRILSRPGGESGLRPQTRVFLIPSNKQQITQPVDLLICYLLSTSIIYLIPAGKRWCLSLLLWIEIDNVHTWTGLGNESTPTVPIYDSPTALFHMYYSWIRPRSWNISLQLLFIRPRYWVAYLAVIQSQLVMPESLKYLFEMWCLFFGTRRAASGQGTVWSPPLLKARPGVVQFPMQVDTNS